MIDTNSKYKYEMQHMNYNKKSNRPNDKITNNNNKVFILSIVVGSFQW